MNYNANSELKKLDEYYPNSDLKHVYIKHRDEIIKLLRAVETVWQNQHIDKYTFNILFKGLQNSWTVVYYSIVGEQINSMIGKIVGIEELIFKGIEDRNWRTRFNTVVIMKALDKREIKNRIIDLGLKDKSKKVKEMATDVKDYYLN
ncbi:MAG: hypothetical protein JNL49_06850 [Bacteroidia bacterium]|nr:hypothetical protein [Bacteroidia bacterium]